MFTYVCVVACECASVWKLSQTAGTDSRPNTLKTKGVLHNIHILFLTKKNRKVSADGVSWRAMAGLVPPNVTQNDRKNDRKREREREKE